MAKAGGELVVFQSPARKGKETGGGLGDKTFEDEVWTEPFEKVDDEVDIFAGGEEMEILRIGLVFGSHACAFDELELMEFECGEWKRGENLRFIEHG